MPLEYVEEIQDIKDNIRTFSEQAKDNLDIVKHFFTERDHNWVYDSDTSQFGPGKFVGYKEMTFERYRKLQSQRKPKQIDGGAAHKKIERLARKKKLVIASNKFKSLTKELKEWAKDKKLGIDLSEKKTDDWKFLEL